MGVIIGEQKETHLHVIVRRVQFSIIYLHVY